jgi:hypothetical protein
MVFYIKGVRSAPITTPLHKAFRKEKKLATEVTEHTERKTGKLE